MGESAIPRRRPACRSRTDGQINERMVGREFHTKHNPHIETQTQWPRQVGRGAVLPARTRVRELYPRVRAYVYGGAYMWRCPRGEREREKERRSERAQKRDGHVHMCMHVHAVERCTYGIT